MSLYEPNNLSRHEDLYKAMSFTESHWLRGLRCMYYPCIEHTRDVESDFYATLGDPIEINITLEDFNKATQDKLNWRAEKDDIPYLAYISNINYPKMLKARKKLTSEELTYKQAMDKIFQSCFNDHDPELYISVTKYAIVELPYWVNSYGTQKFRVTEVQADTIHNFMWYCKLATHRDQVDLLPDTPEVDDHTTQNKDAQIVGNSFLKVNSSKHGVDDYFAMDMKEHNSALDNSQRN